MKYRGITTAYNHDQKAKIGVMLVNLGTPEAPTKKGLKAYLKQFLSDPRVVEVPRLIWWCALNLVILNIRPKRSAHAYQTVWTDKGSPLMLHSLDQQAKVEAQLKQQYGDDIVVELAMTYGKPSIPAVMDNMLAQGVTKLVVLPLYPQYSGTTTAAVFDAITKDLQTRRLIPELRFINHYHDFPLYIKALGDKIKQHQAAQGQPDLLIFSYHGIPKKYLLQGDPYHCECYKTTRLVAQYLGLNESQYMTTFQSRFGREEWLNPYTDETLKSLPAKGIKSVQILSPGFSADCLETLEEICIENRDYFIEAGGEKYQYIEALNSDDNHIEAIVELLNQHLGGWKIEQDLQLTLEQAKKHGG